MSGPLIATMPQFTQLGYHTHFSIEALDPTTGAPVDGVTITDVDIWADVEDGTAGAFTVADPILLGTAV